MESIRFYRRIQNILRDRLRKSVELNKSPSKAVIDGQSAKTTEEGGSQGYDAGKKINVRKRHIIVDCLGLIFALNIQPASIQDRDGAKETLLKIEGLYPILNLIWANGGCRGELIEWVNEHFDIKLEIVKRGDDVKRFEVLPWR